MYVCDNLKRKNYQKCKINNYMIHDMSLILFEGQGACCVKSLIN